MKFTISGISDPGKLRKINQDNFCCDGRIRDLILDRLTFDGEVNEDKGWLAAVFDGMGGEKFGEIASLLAAEATLKYCAMTEPPYDINSLIYDINSKLCDEIDLRMCTMGSTCVYLEFDGDKCRSWNLGDSRAYILHDGALEQLSEDHTEASSYRAVFGDAAVRLGSENRLTQHLGIPADDFIVEPYVSQWNTLEPGDLLLLCSDGLSHLVDDEDITAVMTSSSSIQEKRDQLLELALDNGGKDNVTIILFEAGDSDF
ncbi:MAG: serine/threonine-protein phosphatase [Mogibacterium sp.]|nr:serine/threonine-protein phosphatase [Mogibacterium sp.]